MSGLLAQSREARYAGGAGRRCRAAGRRARLLTPSPCGCRQRSPTLSCAGRIILSSTVGVHCGSHFATCDGRVTKNIAGHRTGGAFSLVVLLSLAASPRLERPHQDGTRLSPLKMGDGRFTEIPNEQNIVGGYRLHRPYLRERRQKINGNSFFMAPMKCD